MENIFQDFSEKILIYCGVESENDPDEKSVDIDMLNAIPIRAIVSDLSFQKSSWAMPGIASSKTKEILVEKKHKALLELSQKIRIDGDDYEGWRESGKIQSKVEGNYLRLFCFIRKYD